MYVCIVISVYLIFHHGALTKLQIMGDKQIEHCWEGLVGDSGSNCNSVQGQLAGGVQAIHERTEDRPS